MSTINEKIKLVGELGTLSHDDKGDTPGFNVSRGEQQYNPDNLECWQKFLTELKLFPPRTPFLKEQLESNVTLAAPIETVLQWNTIFYYKVKDGEILFIESLGFENFSGDYENHRFKLTIDGDRLKRIDPITHTTYGSRTPKSERFKRIIPVEEGETFSIKVASIEGELTAQNFASIVEGFIIGTDLC